jgi:uncharacterized protein YndB with AHSA1/START domain
MSPAPIVERKTFIAASPRKVFRFFIEPASMARWFGEQHTLDPRPGGVFRVVLGSGAIASGTYIAIVPYRRVAFTFGWEGRDDLPPGGSLVEIELEPKDGGTLVRLRHSGVSAQARSPFTERDHATRWAHYLERLEQQCIDDERRGIP